MSDQVVIIDSGIGGLSVFNHLYEKNQDTCITYLADNKFFPYGIKKDYELINIVDRIIAYYMKMNVKYIILACNTASIIYNKYLKYKYFDRVYSIIESTISDLYKIDSLKRIGIVGTDVTINSLVYQKEINQLFDVDLYTMACSDLVDLCENNDKAKIKEYIHKHFSYLKDHKIDTLILACTHFNSIKDIISDYFNDEINIICSGYSLIEYLQKDDICFSSSQNTIYLTNDYTMYREKIKKMYPNLKNVEIKELNI